MRRSLPLRLIVVAVLIAIGAAGVAVANLSRTTRTDVIERSFAVGETLTVRAEDGSINLRPWDENRVSVRRTLRWSGDTVRSDISGGPGEVRLAGSCSTWSSWPVFFEETCSIDDVVRIPRGTQTRIAGDAGNVAVNGAMPSVDVALDSGNVDLGGLRAARSATVRVDSGDVSGDDLRTPELRAATDSGDIDVVFTDAPRTVELRADSGDITLELPDGPYRIRTSADSGDVSVDERLRGGGDRTVTVSTDSGDITIRRRP